MAQLTVLLATTDSEFRAHVTNLLRSSGMSVSVVDERHAGVAPALAVVDIRSGMGGMAPIERLRASWSSLSIFAIASTAEPDHILQAMRAGANEYLTWSPNDVAGLHLDESFLAALRRTLQRSRQADGSRATRVLSFFGAKGGAGTTTLAVNSAIEIARVSTKPTLLIDLHQFLGEVALFLGVRPRFTFVDALDNVHRIDPEFLRELVVKHKTGLDVLAGGDQFDRPGPTDAPAFEQLLQVLGNTYEYIILDVGMLTGPCAEVAVFAADTVYLVANPDIASIRNLNRIIDRLGQLGAGKDRLRILLNRMSDQHQIAPKQIESTLGMSVDMMFQSDYAVVASALNSGVPLTMSNHSELAAQFATFTKQIVFSKRGVPTAEKPQARASFLGLF